MIGRMFYKSEDGLIEYKIVTDPEEAMYWVTYKLKLSNIKILTKCDRSTAAKYRREILEDIKSTEKQS